MERRKHIKQDGHTGDGHIGTIKFPTNGITSNRMKKRKEYEIGNNKKEVEGDEKAERREEIKQKKKTDKKSGNIV